jgi:hypothetical protein
VPTDETSSSETIPSETMPSGPVPPEPVAPEPIAPEDVVSGPVIDTWVSPAGAPAPREADRPRHPVRRLAVVALVVVVLAAAVVGALVFAGSTSTTTASVTGGPAAGSRLLHSSLAAATRAKTFHYVSTSTTAGVTQTTVGDAAPDRGRQFITIGSHNFTILVIGTQAYFQGDAVIMQSQLGLDPVVAQQHAGQWITLQPSDSPYQSVYEAVTTQSALADSITIAPTAVLSTTAIGRTSVTPIRGTLTPVAQTPTTGTARLDVRTASHLPVRFSGTGTVNSQQTVLSVVFGQWGEPVVVVAPAGALAYSSLQIGGLNPGSGGTVLT